MGELTAGLDLILAGLLAATLVHVVRLHRAIGALRGERASLGEAVAGFDSGARRAEAAILRLQEAHQSLAMDLTAGASLKDDLSFLTQRAIQAADRLEHFVRLARGLEQSQPAFQLSAPPRPLQALLQAASPSAWPDAPAPDPSAALRPTIRSQAERDLVAALHGAG